MGLFGSILKGVGSIVGGIARGSSMKKAANLQYQASQDAINEQRRQFDLTRSDYAPYLQAGAGALSQINDLLGISGPATTDWSAYVKGNPDALANWNAVRGTSADTFGGDISRFGEYHYGADGSRRDLAPFTSGGGGGAAGQESALAALRDSPLFQSLYRTGEEAVLQNASATGGLRGGNTQRSLADFGADTFAQVIQRQLANLAGVAGLGAGATDAVSAFGQQSSANIGDLTQQGAAARAGGLLGNSGSIGSGINSALAELAPYLKRIKF